MKKELTIKVKNQIAKELKALWPAAEVKLVRLNGSAPYVTADMGSRYESSEASRRRLADAIAIMKRYAEEYEMNYMVDKRTEAY